MELQIFRSRWGFRGSLEEAIATAHSDGFDGLEAPVPTTPEATEHLAAALGTAQLTYIGEICTGGGYVPRRQATPEEHLTDLAEALSRLRLSGLRPLKLNVIGGCDAWPESVSQSFFRRAIALGQRTDIPLCFETHRSRSLFQPWVTARLVEQIPELHLTADLSHWCVVCERLMDSEWDVIEAIAPRVTHIHARVGYDQGPQVPHPAAPEFAPALASHERCWHRFWEAQLAGRQTMSTLTPEFGPDGYLQELPFTRMPVADLNEINRWMAHRQRSQYQTFISCR